MNEKILDFLENLKIDKNLEKMNKYKKIKSIYKNQYSRIKYL